MEQEDIVGRHDGLGIFLAHCTGVIMCSLGGISIHVNSI